MDIRNQKQIYHLTHIGNLRSIIKNGLLPRKQVIENDLLCTDVANEDILERRSINDLDSYIPFHFYPNTAFDNAVRYQYGAENFVYITYWRDRARQNGFKIVPRHPLNGDFQIYEYDEGVELIDWDVLNRPMSEFMDGDSCNYAKEVKMAECLYGGPISIDEVAYIYCNESRVKELQNQFPLISHKIQKGVWLNGD